MHGDGADELGGECEAYARKSGSDWEEGFAQPLRDKARDSRSKVGSWSEAAEYRSHSTLELRTAGRGARQGRAAPRPPQQHARWQREGVGPTGGGGLQCAETVNPSSPHARAPGGGHNSLSRCGRPRRPGRRRARSTYLAKASAASRTPRPSCSAGCLTPPPAPRRRFSAGWRERPLPAWLTSSSTASSLARISATSSGIAAARSDCSRGSARTLYSRVVGVAVPRQ